MLSFSSAYFSFHVSASFLKLRLCFLCIQSSPSKTISPKPKRLPTPAPIATPFLDDENGDVGWFEEGFKAGGVAVVVTVTVPEKFFALLSDVAVAVTVRIAETVFSLLRDVEPDVRLRITIPAGI